METAHHLCTTDEILSSEDVTNIERSVLKPLSCEELKGAIERRGRPQRLPMLYYMWINPNGFEEESPKFRELLESYPYDIETFQIYMPPVFRDDPNSDYAWVKKSPPPMEKLGYDNRIAIEDWEEFDDMVPDLPRWDDPRMMSPAPAHGEQYRLGMWWYCFFERLWSLRGMENALMDFYLYPERIHQFFGWLTDFYCKMMERAKREMDLDGIFVSDDIGTQTGPFFSPEIFRTFFKPYYARLIAKAHALGMHFWLHCCGNIQAFLPDFVEIGLDVLHPIQKGTMDAGEIGRKWGDKICILAGVDVQYTMAFGTETDVVEELHRLTDAFDRPDGGLLMTFGNGSTPDWKYENVKRLLEETAGIPRPRG